MAQSTKRPPVIFGAMLLIGVALLIVAPTAAKQAKQSKQETQPTTLTNAAGKLVKVNVGDDTRYALQDAAGKNLYYLEAGPKWYHGTAAHPLDKYAGQQVTVTGVVEQPKANKPPKNKNPKANQTPKAPLDAPVLDVYTVNNDKIRDEGKPPWAGGPKNNPNHPGNNGTANGNGNGNGNGKVKGQVNAPGQNKDKGNKPVTP